MGGTLATHCFSTVVLKLKSLKTIEGIRKRFRILNRAIHVNRSQITVIHPTSAASSRGVALCGHAYERTNGAACTRHESSCDLNRRNVVQVTAKGIHSVGTQGSRPDTLLVAVVNRGSRLETAQVTLGGTFPR